MKMTMGPNADSFRCGSSASSRKGRSFGPLLYSTPAAADVSEAVPQDSDSAGSSLVLKKATPVPRPDEPYLYNIPSDLYPTYRPLPFSTKMGTALLSVAIAAITTWKKTELWLPPFLSFRKGHWKKLVWFFVKAISLTIATNCMVQDVFFPPSRVSIQTLMSRYFLPSKLSQYRVLQIPQDLHDMNTTKDLGVHFLEYPYYHNNGTRWDAIYVNHGFGASSLSWLPALPKLVEHFQAGIGLGHDAAGFGFTERPTSLQGFTSEASARTALALLNARLQRQDENATKSVLLLGHSMGCITTLRMALEMDESIQQRIVLVAPALGISPRNGKTGRGRSKHRVDALPRRILSPAQSVLEAPVAYILRRVVGGRKFWRRGLKAVWGDSTRLSESDVLRFQWPSIGRGWERGLVSFARAQSLPVELSDHDLLQKVLERPNLVSLDVIVGTKDRVVPPAQVRRFFSAFSGIKITKMEGFGHDPFEESVENFIQVVGNLW